MGVVGYRAKYGKEDHLQNYRERDDKWEERTVEDLHTKRINEHVAFAQRFSSGFGDAGQIRPEENSNYSCVERGVGPVIEVPPNLFASIVHDLGGADAAEV